MSCCLWIILWFVFMNNLFGFVSKYTLFIYFSQYRKFIYFIQYTKFIFHNIRFFLFGIFSKYRNSVYFIPSRSSWKINCVFSCCLSKWTIRFKLYPVKLSPIWFLYFVFMNDSFQIIQSSVIFMNKVHKGLLYEQSS